MGGDAHALCHIPDLDFAIERAAEEILSSVAPVERGNPGRSAAGRTEIAHMLTMVHIVDRNDTGISSGRESFASGREGYRADGLCEA